MRGSRWDEQEYEQQDERASNRVSMLRARAAM
jgi:hypothetical protein